MGKKELEKEEMYFMCQPFAKRLYAISLLAALCLVGSSLNAFAVEQEGTSVSITGELQVFTSDSGSNGKQVIILPTYYDDWSKGLDTISSSQTQKLRKALKVYAVPWM